MDLLQLVANERKAAVGFDNDALLKSERELSLEYMKGQMRDVPSLPNRSKAVSTDINDAIETLLPDVIEIFTGSDDVVAFTPVGEEDEEAAQQETDYINHVVFHENDGFMLLYQGFKDALSVKTGVWTWGWDDYRFKEEAVEVSDEETLKSLVMGASEGKYEIVGVEPGETFKVTLKKPDGGGCVWIKCVPPEDFAVARDTILLRDATYCAMRTRPRAQDLIADGYDEDKVNRLPQYVVPDDEIERARDTAGESDEMADTALRQVEIVSHYIRVVENGKPQLYRIVTGADETIELEREKVDAIHFAAVTPYPVPHRFYGRSVADLVMDIQRIRTSLLRMFLDFGYFALNQRHEVAESDSSANTLADLLRNEPGVPVRSKTGNAVRPISAGGLNFDVQGALEYAATMSEQRTGIIRNAQGLNPDTLHDTAKGASQQLGQALKRTRLIARIFAETGVRDLFLGVHAMIRAHASRKQKARLRNKWVEIDPTSWGSRNDMTIELGVGAGGREFEIQKSQMLANILGEVRAAAPGLVPVEKVYNAGKVSITAAGYKDPDRFLASPEMVNQTPQPDPAVVKAEADARIKMAELQMKDRLERDRMAAEFELRREEMQIETELKLQEMQAKALMGQTLPAPTIRDVQTGGAVG